MLQPIPQTPVERKAKIYCFTCNKEVIVMLKSYELEKKITCPECGRKEAVIQPSF